MSSRGKRTGARTTRKKVRNAKSKEVDGIKFRSLLEAHCYRQLRDAGIEANYVKKKYVLMEGFHYSSSSYEDNGKTGFMDKKKYKVRDITYTPDFVDPQGRWVIECKGYANERFPLKWKMFKKLLMESDNPPVLYVPRNQKQNIETVKMILELIAPTK